MSHGSVGRMLGGFPFVPRKRITICLMLLLITLFSSLVINMSNSRLEREDAMEQQLADMRSHLLFLQAQYRGRQEDVMYLYGRAIAALNDQEMPQQTVGDTGSETTTNPEVISLLKNISGTQAAAGVNPKALPQLRIPFVFQLLPHLMNDQTSLKPAYHMKAGRNFVDVVIGIPTVKRDKENYLMITLKHLVDGLTPNDYNSTLIVVMVGETDLEYVLNTARKIEVLFLNEVKSGLIEVISPSAAYYPNFETLPTTLGDSHKRVIWRTKQNLDAIYLMAYAQSKGTFYLMMEDDVIAKKNYMQNIKTYAAATTVLNPQWFFIEYCQMGGIGKLFKSSDLVHFITYVQLFYNNMPIDWLLESYLADRVCTIDKTSKVCGTNKLQIRPKYQSSLFQHIGLYSSLQGKIQPIKVRYKKDPNFGPTPTYYPHDAPVPERLRIDVEVNSNHSLKKVYQGQTFFLGMKPKKGDTLEFWFANPTAIEKFTFWNGKDGESSDKINNTVIEILPFGKDLGNFTTIDNFGTTDGAYHEIGPLDAIRLRVTNESFHWIVLSEGKGAFCQMTEDDNPTKNSIQNMKKFAAQKTITEPRWFFIQFCQTGGIGKLFRSSDLTHFLTYVQLFYHYLPIDWLLESYLADRVCTIDKTSKACGKNKLQIRPKYKTSLFQHIGFYSSLKGKVQKIKDTHFGTVPTFYPHDNPPLERVHTSIEAYMDHTLIKAYEGTAFFWGMKLKKGDVVEFWFKKPTAIEKFIFRSSNIAHMSDKFYNTVIEILSARKNSSFTIVGNFDEFGLADGVLKREIGPLAAIRLRVTKDSKYWAVLSEIYLKPFDVAQTN